MSSALLYTVFGLHSILTSTQVPSNIWKLLGNNLVVTPQALLWVRPIPVPYILLSTSNVIEDQITGAVIAGESPFIAEQVSLLLTQPGWFSRAILVILSSRVDLQIFRQLWIKRIANVVMITETESFYYNPFIDTVIPVDEHVSENLIDRWKDMHGYIIQVSMYDQELSFMQEFGISLGAGIDGSALYELSQYWNMTVHLKVTKDMENKYNSSEKKVLQGKADLSLNANSILRGNSKFEYSSAIYDDTVCMVFKNPNKLRGWDVLLRIYDWRFYAALSLTAFITNKALKLVSPKRNGDGSIRMVLRSMFNVSIIRISQSIPERIILGSVMIFGLVIITVYQASMLHLINSNVHYRPMETLLDVFYSDIPLRSNAVILKDFFVTWDLKAVRKLGRRIEIDEINDGTLEYAGLVLREKELRLFQDSNLLRNDLYILPERIGSFTMAYSVKKGSPFLQPLTEFTFKVFEAGLFEKWYRLTASKISKYKTPTKLKPMRVFSLQDTELAFIALFVELPPQVVNLLGHSIIISPQVLQRLPKVNFPHILARYGDIVEGEVTGAVIAGNRSILHEQIAFLSAQKGWMARAMVVVLADRPKRKVFVHLWKRRVINAVCFTGTKLYTYNPFNDKILELDKEDIEKQMDARWMDLEGYRITIAMHIHDKSAIEENVHLLKAGIDGIAIFELAKHWNVTLNLKNMKDPDRMNLQLNQMILSGYAEIAMSSRHIRQMSENVELEFTTSVYVDSLVIALKTASKFKSKDIYINMFSWKVWLALLGSLIFLNRAIIWSIKRTHWSYSFGIIIQLICCVPLTKLPTSTRERLVLGTGFFVGLATATTFQAAMFRFIKEGGIHNRFKTVQEVISHHNKLVTNSKLIKLYLYAFEDEDITPKESIEVVPVTDEWLERFPMFINLKKIQMLMRTGRIRSDLYFIQENLCSYSVSYTVKRGSPYLKRLSKFTSQVFESGLSEKWHTMSIDEYETKSKMYTAVSDERTNMDFDVAFTIFSIELPQQLLNALGHSVIITPCALDKLSRVDMPIIVVDYGNIVGHEITGAIIAGKGGYLQEQVSLLRSQQGWMARAMVIIITESPKRRLFRYLWTKKIMNAIIYDTKAQLYAYNPFNDTMLQVKEENIMKTLEERWRDLHGYRVGVVLYNHNLSFRMELGLSLGAGIDGSAIYELAKHWNMTVDVKGTGDSEHKIHLSNRMLYNGQAELSMNSRFVNRKVKDEDRLEYTSSIYGDSVVIVVKTPHRLRGWDVFAGIFSWTVWLGCLQALIITERAMLWLAKDKNYYASLSITVRSLANVPIIKIPTSAPERFVLGSAFCVGLVMVTVFQASLFHFIKEGTTYERMKTLSEARKNIKLMCDSRMIRDFLQTDDMDSRKLKKLVPLLPLKNEYLDEYALAIRQKEIQLLMQSGSFRTDLYIVEEKVSSFTMSYVVLKGSPFLKPLSRFASQAFESGLCEVWYRMTVERLSEGKTTKPEDTKVRVLTLNDIEVAFFVLVLGMLISLTIFLLELLTKYVHQRRMRGLRKYINRFLNCMYPK